MSSTASLYYRFGGEPVLREFVDHLYGFMEILPEVAHVREMHSEDLSHASDRLFMFLSGMLGGPDLYVEAFGHPRLRRKHLHFAIDAPFHYLLHRSRLLSPLPVFLHRV